MHESEEDEVLALLVERRAGVVAQIERLLGARLETDSFDLAQYEDLCRVERELHDEILMRREGAPTFV